jgi:hypothetical protein
MFQPLRSRLQVSCGSVVRGLVVGLLATVVITGVASTPADALTPQICKNYAASAVKDFADTSRKPRCTRRENNRWHKNYDRHYNWCLTAIAAPVKMERDVRNGFHTRCGARVKID